MAAPKEIKAARFYSHHDIRIEHIPPPQANDNEVLVDVAWGGICGTDLHEYTLGPIATKDQPGGLPVTFGHEFCGYVRDVPAGVKDATGVELKNGTPVMVDPRLNCASCHSCTSGSSNVCRQWGFLGLGGRGGGGFSDTAAVRTDMLHALPKDTRLDHAVLIEPLAVGRHALTASGVPIDGWKDLSVLVIGGGPVGFATLCNLRIAGCEAIYVSEPTAQRQQQCRTWAKAIFDPTAQNVPEECRAVTRDNAGVDVVFDCAGIAPGMRDGFAALRAHGTYCNLASWETPFEIPLVEFLMKEITIKPSLAYTDKDFADVVADFVAGKFAGAEDMISARIGLDELVAGGLEELVRRKEKHSKIIVTPRADLLSSANA